MDLSIRGQVYVATVIALGLIAVGLCIAGLSVDPVSPEWMLLALLTLLTGSVTVRVPGLPARISVSETFVFTSVLLFGTAAATLTVALDTVVASLVARRNARQVPLKILFNLASASLSIWLASSAFYAISGLARLSIAPAPLPSILGPLVTMTALYFVLNSGFVAVALSFEKGQPAFQIWQRNFLWLSVNYFGGASAAALLVAYTQKVDLFAIGMIVPLVIVSYLTYRTSIGRVEDANRHLDEVKRLHLSTIETLATAIDAKDQVTHGHIRRVQQHTLGLARALGVTDIEQISAIEAAALLHDLGKLVVPEHILNKPGKLTVGEFERMKLHARVGADILSSIRFPYPVVPIVRHHHENWDGSGYPDALRGTQIPLGARILSVVDCFDALTSDRPYRTRLSDEEAIAILMSRRGSMYDPLIVDTFIANKDALTAAYLQNSPVGSAEALPPVYPPPSVESYGTPVLDLEFSSLLKTVLNSLQSELSTSAVVLYMKDTRTDDLYVAGKCGPDSARIGQSRLPVGSHISGWVVANGRRISNADSHLEMQGVFRDNRVCLSVPLMSAGHTVGALTLISQPGKAFDDPSIEFVESIARTFDEPLMRGLIERQLAARPSSTSRQATVH